METYIIIQLRGGEVADCELIDTRPSPSLIQDLDLVVREGRIDAWEIRCGNINGGDSTLEIRG